MLTSPRRVILPAALAQRIDALRDDEMARDQLHRRVTERRRARGKQSSKVVSARSQLVQQLKLEHETPESSSEIVPAAGPDHGSECSPGHPPAASPVRSPDGPSSCAAVRAVISGTP